jgi:hypothetical protein
MQQAEAGLEFLLCFGDLELQTRIRVVVAIHKRAVHGKAHGLWKQGHGGPQATVQKTFDRHGNTRSLNNKLRA